MVVSDGTSPRISIKHSGFNPDSVIKASFKVLNAVPDIMNKVQLLQDRILTDQKRANYLESGKSATTLSVTQTAQFNGIGACNRILARDPADNQYP
jgi:hypothetical protein